MSKGKMYPPESKTFRDERTGYWIRQITNNPSIHHHPYFYIPAYDDAAKRTIFVSHRTGSPQIFAEWRETGDLLQLTDRKDINEWSVHPAHNGRFVYFTAGTAGWRVNTETFEEERLVDFADDCMRSCVKVSVPNGATSLCRDDRWWAVHYKQDGDACLAVVETETGDCKTILKRDDISQVQFCPDDSNLLFYAGPLYDRVWMIHRDGTGNRRLYERDAANKQWITHESWIPGSRELAMIDWPHGIRSVHADTGDVRQVASFNAWHAVCSRDGKQMVADTNFPDIGLQLFKPLNGASEPKTLCFPEASNQGAHWGGPFPYDYGPIQVHSQQHTHPHPSFSPDGRRVIYTSDRSGFSQIYEVLLDTMNY